MFPALRTQPLSPPQSLSVLPGTLPPWARGESRTPPVPPTPAPASAPTLPLGLPSPRSKASGSCGPPRDGGTKGHRAAYTECRQGSSSPRAFGAPHPSDMSGPPLPPECSLALPSSVVCWRDSWTGCDFPQGQSSRDQTEPPLCPTSQAGTEGRVSPLEAGPSLQSPQALSSLQSRWWGQDHTATHPGWSPADAGPGFLPVSHDGRGSWRHYQPSAPPPTPPSPGRNPGKCKEGGDTASHPVRGPSWCMGQEEGPSLLDTPSHGSTAIKEPPVSGSRKVPLEPHSPLGESEGGSIS